MVTEEKQDRAVLHGSVGLDGVTLDYIYLFMSLTNISRAAKLKNDHNIFSGHDTQVKYTNAHNNPVNTFILNTCI